MSRLFRLLLFFILYVPRCLPAQTVAVTSDLCQAEYPNAFLHGNIKTAVMDLEISLPDGFKFLQAEAALSRSVKNGISIDRMNNLIGIVLHEGDTWHPDSMSYMFRITYLPCGYIHEEVFDEMDTEEMSREKEEMIAALSEKIVSTGGLPITFSGWQEVPRFDKLQHCLYWAQEQFTSGIDQRYADWHAVKLGANMIVRIDVDVPIDSNDRVRNELTSLVNAISFPIGERYEDFNSSTGTESELDASDLIFQREKSKSASDRRAFLWQTGIALFMIILFALVIRYKKQEL